MRIGTTPTHSFKLPVDEDFVKSIEITYSQNDKVILQKYKHDCTITGKKLFVRLSQEDTFQFKSGVNVEIQVRVLDRDNEVHGCDVVVVSCKKCLSTEVLL